MNGAAISGTARLSVVIAVKESDRNIADILARLEPSRHTDVQFIFCIAREIPAALHSPSGDIRVMQVPSSRLVPHLWRDGIREATGDRVAITTAQCLPPAEWIDRLLAADLSSSVGLGGPIENDAGSTPAQWATFFLRYVQFAPPQCSRETKEIPADNAIYRRADILRHDDLLDGGFWEPSFHARFLADGLKLRMEPRLLTVYRGCGSPWHFVRHRFQHGRQFGMARAEAMGFAMRLVFLLASPLVSLVLSHRIAKRATADPVYRRHFLGALPWLLLFVVAWSAGEAAGYARALFLSCGSAAAGKPFAGAER